MNKTTRKTKNQKSSKNDETEVQSIDLSFGRK